MGEKYAPNGRKTDVLKVIKQPQYQILGRWLGREDSNLRMAESKSAALPLGYAPMTAGLPVLAASGRQDSGAIPQDQ